MDSIKEEQYFSPDEMQNLGETEDYVNEYTTEYIDEYQEDDLLQIKELFEKKKRIQCGFYNIPISHLLIGAISTLFGSGLVYSLLYKRKQEPKK